MNIWSKVKMWFGPKWPEGEPLLAADGERWGTRRADGAIFFAPGFYVTKLCNEHAASSLTTLLNERDEIATTLANWRARWDIAVAAERGTAETSMAGLVPLDEFAHDLAYSAPSRDGGATQPPLLSAGSASQ